MKVEFQFKKTGTENSIVCEMDAIPPVGAWVFPHPLRYVESVPRTVKEVYWFAKEPHDDHIDVKIVLS